MRYAWQCTTCKIQVEITRPIAESHISPDPDVECGGCTVPEWKRVYEMPGLTKASYPDGMRRFSAMKEAAKLNKESIQSRSSETKKEIAAEINKMGVRIKSDNGDLG